MFSVDLARFAEAGWQRVLGLLKERSPQTAGALEQERTAGTPEEQLLFAYLVGTLPITDLGDYPPALLMEHVRHGLKLQEEFSWCQALPEPIFLKDVLPPRVNTESLSPCRPVFYEQLAPRVRGLGLPEAILEVNRWCAENVVYRSTDQRTASALAVYRCGYGRCGEESTFAVNALRSVGIGARQVYAPWWSHCDDNHAWVEAFDGETWRFLGACEPEPRLDMGWFTRAAGRAMLAHTRVFVGEGNWDFLFPGVSPLDLDVREGVAYESVTARYAPVRPFTVEVTGPLGQPAAGARVELYILNEGVLRSIAQRTTGQDGAARLNLGLGSLWATAEDGDLWAEALVDATQDDRVELTLSAKESAAWAEDFSFTPPPDGNLTLPSLTLEERRAKAMDLDRAKERRAQRPQACQPQPADEKQRQALLTLTKKDWDQGVRPEVLADCQNAFAHQAGLPPQVFEAGLLSPRVGLEPLAPWRVRLQEAPVDGGPEEIFSWLQEHILPTGSYQDLPQTPAGAWKLKLANNSGVLFCALCRAKGIPARIGPHGEPEVWQEGRFRLVGTTSAALTIGPAAASGQLGLMKWSSGWRQVEGAAPGAELALPPGRYRLITSTRLPTGAQLARRWDFTLSPGQKMDLAPSFRQGSGQELLQCLPLPDFRLVQGGREQAGRQVLAQAPVSLLCWVEPGAEPTEHLYNELAIGLAALNEAGCQVHMIGPQEPPVPSGAQAWQSLGDEAGQLARRLYLEPGLLPLVVLADRAGNARFACAGYNVGLVELVGACAGMLVAEPLAPASSPV